MRMRIPCSTEPFFFATVLASNMEGLKVKKKKKKEEEEEEEEKKEHEDMMFWINQSIPFYITLWFAPFFLAFVSPTWG